MAMKSDMLFIQNLFPKRQAIAAAANAAAAIAEEWNVKDRPYPNYKYGTNLV